MSNSELVIIGCSVGGLQATQTILKGLKRSFRIPIVIVQHRDKSPGLLLSQLIQDNTSLKVQDADDGMKVLAGNVYLAPAGYHLLIDNKAISLSTDLPVKHAQPSIDVAFDSAARCYFAHLVGVILTSSSLDGVEGALSIESRGGSILVQDPVTAENSTLPKAVIAATKSARVLTLEDIAKNLSELCVAKGGRNAIRPSC